MYPEKKSASTVGRRRQERLKETLMADFKDKKVLILGGSRGIGAAIVRRFASGGAQVAFTYAGSTDAAQVLAAETGAEAIQTDSADRAALIATVASRGAVGAVEIRRAH